MSLELFDFCENITQFKAILAKVSFHFTVDYFSLPYINENKTEPASARIKRLLEVLSAYLHYMAYMKGKKTDIE